MRISQHVSILLFYFVLMPHHAYAICVNPKGVVDQYFYNFEEDVFVVCTENGWNKKLPSQEQRPEEKDKDNVRKFLDFAYPAKSESISFKTPEDCPDVGDQCADGSYFIGNLQNRLMYATSEEFESSQTWNRGIVDKEIKFTLTGAVGEENGRKNTRWLADFTGKAAPYKAAVYCDQLKAHGKGDWYLPAKDELNLFWNNGEPIANIDTEGGKVNSDFYYWSSTEPAYYLGAIQRFSDGSQINFYKHTDKLVRCVRY